MKLDNIIARRPKKTVYRDGELCIKVFDSSFRKAEVLNEALNISLIEETGIRIPKLVEVTTVEGQWALVYEYVEGKTLSELIKENPDKLDEYLDKFVDVQLDIQAHKCRQLKQLKDKMQGKISLSGLDATTRYELHVRLDGMETHNKICHGDFTPSNVIIGSDGEATVIDWAHVTQGNASADAARTYLIFSLKGEDEYAAKYLSLFCKKSDTARQYVEKWMPIVAASQLVKGKPEEREFLLRWANVMDSD